MVWWLWVAVGAAVLATAFIVLTRYGPVVRLQRRWVWCATDVLPASTSMRSRPVRTRAWLRNKLTGAVSWLTGTPLYIEDLDAGDSELGGAAIAHTLRTAIARGASLGRAGPELVAVAFTGRTLLSDVAGAVSTAPQGKIIGALLTVVGRVVRRDDLHLTGAVVSSRRRGPGLTLTLTRGNGVVVDTVMMWANEYELDGHGDAPPGDEAERMMRVVTAAAAWVNFAVLRVRLALTESEYRERLGTSSWQSYAYLRAGVYAKITPSSDPVARALFARAVDADPDNRLAQYNLAFMEATDRHEQQAASRLDHVHRNLEGRDGTASPAALLKDPQTLDRDPFHYQVASLRAAVALNLYAGQKSTQANARKNSKATARNNSKATARNNTKERRIAFERLKQDWDELTDDLVALEAALALLEPVSEQIAAPADPGERAIDKARRRRDRRWQLGLPSAADVEQRVLGSLLRRIEPPMLLRWAMMRDEILGAAPRKRAKKIGSEQLDRRTLSRRLAASKTSAESLAPATVIQYFLRKRARLDGNTLYELACYYTQAGDKEMAVRELRESCAAGSHRAKWAAGDPQLAALTRRKDFKELMAAYNGQRAAV